MAFWDRIFRRKQGEAFGGSQNIVPLQTLEGFFTSRIGQELLASYKGWTFAGVNAIAKEVAKMNPRLFRNTKDGVEEVEDHPSIQLLHFVNPRMTLYQLMFLSSGYIDLEGNTFWLVDRDDQNNPIAIWPIRPDRVGAKAKSEEPFIISEYKYRARQGKNVIFPAERVVHIANFNAQGEYPFPVRGVATILAAAVSIDTDNFASEWNRNFFLRSARPDMLINLKGGDETAVQQTMNAWNAQHKGVNNAHKTAFIGGDISIEQLGFPPKDMDFTAMKNLARDEILSILGVPKSILGLPEGSNRASAREMTRSFLRTTVEPRMTQIIDTLNEMYLPMFSGTEEMFLSFDSPVPEDRELRLNELDKGIDRWISRNEAREMLGLPPTEDGDEFKDRFGFTIDRVTPVTRSAEESVEKKVRQPKAPEYEKKPGVKALVESSLDAIAKNKREGEQEIKSHQLRLEAVKKFGVMWKQQIYRGETLMSDAIKRYFEEQTLRVLNHIAQEVRGFEASEIKTKAVGDLLPSRKFELKALIDLATPLFRRFAKTAGDEAILLVGSDLVFNDDDPEVATFTADRAEVFAENITRTTYDKLESTLATGLDEGEGIELLSDRVREVFQGARKNRAPLIARTEVSAISNFGNMQAYRQVGIAKHQWIIFDPQDALCIDNDGQIVKVGESFNSGDDAPPVHPNCVCTTIPIFG